MTFETAPTAQEVLKIATTGEYDHPVADLFRTNFDPLETAIREYTTPKPTPEAILSLADQIEDLDEFTLTPRDLVGIWTEVRKLSGFGHTFGATVIAAYAIQGVPTQNWRRFPRNYLVQNELPEEVRTDKDGLLYVQQRTDYIKNSLDLLEPASNELTSHPVGIKRTELLESIISSSDGLFQRYGRFLLDPENRPALMIEFIQDDLGNGLALSPVIKLALRKLNTPEVS